MICLETTTLFMILFDIMHLYINLDNVHNQKFNLGKNIFNFFNKTYPPKFGRGTGWLWLFWLNLSNHQFC